MAQYEYDICLEQNSCRSRVEAKRQSKKIITIGGRGEMAMESEGKGEIYTSEGQRTNQVGWIYQVCGVNKHKIKKQREN